MPESFWITYRPLIAEAEERAEKSRATKKRSPRRHSKEESRLHWLQVMVERTAGATVDIVGEAIYAQLLVPKSHQLLRFRGKKGWRLSEWNQTLDEALDNLPKHARNHEVGRRAAFHLETFIPIAEYQEGKKFFKTFQADGSFRRRTLAEAMSEAYSVQILRHLWRKNIFTRFLVVLSMLTLLMPAFEMVKSLLPTLSLLKPRFDEI